MKKYITKIAEETNIGSKPGVTYKVEKQKEHIK